jgi:hypothetical protein
MIWGLEGEDTKDRDHRHRADNGSHHNQQTALQSGCKPHTHQQPTQFLPPRFASQKARRGPEPHYKVPSVNTQLLTPEPEYEQSVQTNALKHGSHVDQYTLPSHGPIDLSELMRPKDDDDSNLYYEDDFSSNAAGDLPRNNLHNYGSTGDVLDWQTLFLAQQGLRNSMTASTHPASGDYLGNYMKGSRSSELLSLPSLLNSRSPIVLDPPSQLPRTVMSQHSPVSSQHTVSALNTPASSHVGSQRMSALEIAQKYRKQQMLQQKTPASLLPTPPSSSSPLWSAGFSPYPDSTWSPETLAAAGLPNLSAGMDVASQQLAFLRQAQVLEQLRSSDHARLGISGREARARNWLLAPAAQIQDHINDYDSLVSSNSLNLAAFRGLSLYPPQPQSVPQISPGVLPHHTPARPLPSPSMPMGSVGLRAQGTSENQIGTSALTPSRSPPSPKSRPRNISQQNPRSIPLTRLVQRLSSVPEEELCISSDHARSPVCNAPPSAYMRLSTGGVASAIPIGQQQGPVEPIRQKRKPVLYVTASSSRTPEGKKTHGEEQSFSGSEGKASLPCHTVIHEGQGTTSTTEAHGKERTSSPGRRRTNNRGRGRNWRGRRPNACGNGPERVDGGLTVRS